MHDVPPPPPRDSELPEALPRRKAPHTLQLVWLIPIIAALIGGWMAAKAFLDRGPTIEIQFKSAEGIEAGKTKIRHKSVDIGVVRSVQLSGDRKAVIVRAEMDRQVSRGFLVSDTKFWVVRPRVAGGQVSGLGTLLAGSFIGADPGKEPDEKREFVGLEAPPAITSDVPGRPFKIRAEDLGSLDVGSAVYYRGVTAGRVTSIDLTEDGKAIVVGVFVEAPYDRWVNAETRFWNASGVDLTFDAGGLKLQTQSVITLLLGGIAFESRPEHMALEPAPSEAEFFLWDNRSEALKPRESVVEAYVMVFEQSVRGLAVGAPIDFRGVEVGEVRQIDLDFDRDKIAFRTAVTVYLYPERLRSRTRNTNANSKWNQLSSQERVARMVESGLRGQLKASNLLTGQQFIALDFFKNVPPVKMDLARVPPEIPTTVGGLSEIQDSIGNIVKNLERVPFDKIAADLRNTMKNLDATLKRAEGLLGKLSTQVDELAPEVRSTLENAKRTLSAAEKTLATDSPLQGDLREALTEVTRAAESVRGLTDYLERHPEALLRGKRPQEQK